jgi:ATP/maltotriose-dependent transcriptional regulator MalT
MSSKQKRVRVRFSVDDDEQASKITALLEALGYEPNRELEQGSAVNRLRWAVSRLAGQARLTERERDILDRVLQGASNNEISETLQISKATVKWHMHNIFTKTGSRTREALLRDALQLRTTPVLELVGRDDEPAAADEPVRDDEPDDDD